MLPAEAKGGRQASEALLHPNAQLDGLIHGHPGTFLPDLVRSLLPVVDDFERAMRVETPDREYAKGIENQGGFGIAAQMKAELLKHQQVAQ